MYVRSALFAAAIGTLALSSQAHAQAIGVAGTSGCIYFSLQEALDDGATNLTIASNLGILSSGQVFSISNFPAGIGLVRIRGAGSNCTGSGRPLVNMRDVFTGTNQQFAEIPAGVELQIQNLEFVNGADNMFDLQPQIFPFAGFANLFLDDVEIRHTQGTVIRIGNFNARATLWDSGLYGGTDDTPIIVNGGDLTLEDSGVAYNTGGTDGGGIRLIDGTLEMTNSNLVFNFASGDGGGLWVGNNGLGGLPVSILGGDIRNNSADGDGGGIYVTDADESCSQVNCARTVMTVTGRVRSNSGDPVGGIALTGHSVLSLFGDVTTNNGNGVRFIDSEGFITGAEISGNSGDGIGVVVRNDSDVQVTRSIISDNDGRGFMVRSGSTLEIANSLIADNGGDGVDIHDAHVEIELATIVGNARPIDYSSATGAVVSTVMNGNSSAGHLRNHSVVTRDCVSDGIGWVVTSGTVNEINAVPTGLNPMFIGGGNYRLQATSPLIDRCVNGSRPDLDGNGVVGTLDVGAFERQ